VMRKSEDESDERGWLRLEAFERKYKYDQL
jgi:hypothetical protein